VESSVEAEPVAERDSVYAAEGVVDTPAVLDAESLHVWLGDAVLVVVFVQVTLESSRVGDRDLEGVMEPIETVRLAVSLMVTVMVIETL
jgi:hypothetical protein